MARANVVEEILKKELDKKYHFIVKRYAKVLTARAIRFYFDSNFDSGVINEDLYNGEDFDCSCSQEDADKSKHKKKCIYYGGKNFVNLKYSEDENKKWLNSKEVNHG